MGFDIVRSRPAARISGTFPPHKEYESVGHAANYFIHDGYQHRTEIKYFDDSKLADEWQREVYQFARETFDGKQLAKVCDIGCGSAYKLIKNFGHCDFVGLDVSSTCLWLRKKYPHFRWMEVDFANPPSLQADLVIAADVIEHLLEPNALLSYIAAFNPRYIVFSTPDRNLFRAGTHNGPPLNPAHVREWSFAEFEAYIDSRFEVLEHFISNNLQSTQCLLCEPRR
jgi:SAM-dependent methyltransferase